MTRQLAISHGGLRAVNRSGYRDRSPRGGRDRVTRDSARRLRQAERKRASLFTSDVCKQILRTVRHNEATFVGVDEFDRSLFFVCPQIAEFHGTVLVAISVKGIRNKQKAILRVMTDETHKNAEEWMSTRGNDRLFQGELKVLVQMELDYPKRSFRRTA